MPVVDPSHFGPHGAEATASIGPWSARSKPEPELEAAFSDLIDALRRLQDRAAGTRPTVQVARDATRLITVAADQLAGFEVGESEQIAGKLSGVAGRAQSLIPPVRYHGVEDDCVDAGVTFTRFYLGSGGAAHGGPSPSSSTSCSVALPAPVDGVGPAPPISMSTTGGSLPSTASSGCRAPSTAPRVASCTSPDPSTTATSCSATPRASS